MVDCSHKINRCLHLGRKAMTNPDSILKSRDITLPTKVCLLKAIVFPVVMYGCESWTIGKAEHWRTDAFELWCWRRLLRVPWTARRLNQSIPKEINPGYSLEGVMLKLESFGHLMEIADTGKGSDAGNNWGQEEKGATKDEMVWWHHQLNRHEFEQIPGDNEGQESLVFCSSWGCKEIWLSDWTAMRNTQILKNKLKIEWTFSPT